MFRKMDHPGACLHAEDFTIYEAAELEISARKFVLSVQRNA